MESALWPHPGREPRVLAPGMSSLQTFPVEQNFQNRRPNELSVVFPRLKPTLGTTALAFLFLSEVEPRAANGCIIMAGKPDDTSSPNKVHSDVGKPGGGLKCSTGGAHNGF